MQIHMRVGGVLPEDRPEKLVVVTERSAGEVCEYPKLQLLLCGGVGGSILHPGEIAQGNRGDPRFSPQYD